MNSCNLLRFMQHPRLLFFSSSDFFPLRPFLHDAFSTVRFLLFLKDGAALAVNYFPFTAMNRNLANYIDLPVPSPREWFYFGDDDDSNNKQPTTPAAWLVVIGTSDSIRVSPKPNPRRINGAIKNYLFCSFACSHQNIFFYTMKLEHSSICMLKLIFMPTDCHYFSLPISVGVPHNNNCRKWCCIARGWATVLLLRTLDLIRVSRCYDFLSTMLQHTRKMMIMGHL